MNTSSLPDSNYFRDPPIVLKIIAALVILWVLFFLFKEIRIRIKISSLIQKLPKTDLISINDLAKLLNLPVETIQSIELQENKARYESTKINLVHFEPFKDTTALSYPNAKFIIDYILRN